MQKAKRKKERKKERKEFQSLKKKIYSGEKYPQILL